MKTKKWLAVALSSVMTLGMVAFGGCAEDGEGSDNSGAADVTVYMLDGAPAMAFAKLMAEDTEQDGVTYRVVNPAVIATKVTNSDMSKNADLCALPLTAASKLLGTGEKYQMMGVVTNGNLCVLSKDEAFSAAVVAGEYKDLSYLVGKTVGVMQINNVPGLTFKSILDEYGLEWQVLGNDGSVAADKVNLKAIADATAIDPTDENVTCYVVAEPAASVQVKKNAFEKVCSLDLLYNGGEVIEDCTGQTFLGYPQAVLVAKKSLVEAKTEWINSFLDDLSASTEALYTDWANGETIVSAVTAHQEDPAYKTTLNATVLSRDVIAACAARFTGNSIAMSAVNAYLARVIAVDAASAKAVSEGFFYQGWTAKN